MTGLKFLQEFFTKKKCELNSLTITFYLERIRDATIYNPKPIII